MRISLILLILVFVCEFVVLMGVTGSGYRRVQRVATTRKPGKTSYRHVRQASRNQQLHRGFGTVGTRRTSRAFPSQATKQGGFTARPTFRTTIYRRPNVTPFRRPTTRLQAPPRRAFNTRAVEGPPGIRPPRGIADRLNRARLKDFMALGAFLLRRQRQLLRIK